MPNFDALRTASMGALSYICRPIEKPAELQALFPLDNSTENLAGTSAGIIAGDYVTGCFNGTKAGSNVSGLYALGSSWTIDFVTQYEAASVHIVNFNSCSLYVGTSSGTPTYFLNKSGWITISGPVTVHSWHHIAVTCDGSSIYVYFDGVRTTTQTVTTNSATLSTSTNPISNFRIVSKCLTTGSTFPVPSGLYTGYEAL